MRSINAIFCLVLVLFAVSQYNDPDGLFWLAAYMLGAIWCGLAALRPSGLAARPSLVLYILSLAAAALGVVVFWPDTPRWWMQEVWWDTETAREGMGFMIILAALLVAGTVALRRRA